jgi:hypothetical protein
VVAPAASRRDVAATARFELFGYVVRRMVRVLIKSNPHWRLVCSAAHVDAREPQTPGVGDASLWGPQDYAMRAGHWPQARRGNVSSERISS